MVDKKGWRLADYFLNGKKRLADILSLGKPSNNDLIGLTISSDYINLLKIISTDSHYKVENFDLVAMPVPANSVVKNEIKDPVAVAKIIKKLFRQSHITSRNVVVCIPRSLVIMKNLSVNSQLTMDEIESKVWIEANRLFPNLVEDIYLDFTVIGPSSQDATQLDILVVACRKVFINPYLETLALAELNAKIIDIDYFAYERVLALLAKQSPDIHTIALLNLSFSYIDLIVTHEGKAIFTHGMAYDGSGLKQNCQKLVKRQKYVMATDGTDFVDSSSQNNQRNVLNLGLGMQIKHTMQFFYSSRPNVRLERIILSGDCTIHVPDLLAYVQSETGKEVVLANPFKDMIFSSHIDKTKLAKHASALVLCCGTALRNLK